MMKAHIPLKYKLTKQTQKDMLALAEQELSKKQFGFTRRLFKAFCYCLNRDFGFGKKRLESLIDSVNKMMNEVLTDEAFWEHLDRVVIDELGIEFEREEVNEDGEVIQ